MVLECLQAQGEAPPHFFLKFSDDVNNINVFVFMYM